MTHLNNITTLQTLKLMLRLIVDFVVTKDAYISEEITTTLHQLKPESLAELTYAILSDEAIEIELEKENSK